MPIEPVVTSPHGDNETKWSDLEDHLRALPAKGAVAALAAVLEDLAARIEVLEVAPTTKAARAGLESR